MPAPVILLTFANAKDDYLPTLNREQKNIQRQLRYHDDQGVVNLKVLSAATADDIFDYVNTYNEDLHIFHFSGHAGNAGLLLETPTGGNKKGNATGLAGLLGSCPKLKLVILNGCATYDFAELLFNEGVPLVLATRSRIDDIMAAEFAEQFYNKLGSHTTIDTAAKIAFAFLQFKYEQFANYNTHRGIALPDNDPGDQLPWALYGHPDGRGNDAMEWHIPSQVSHDRTPAPIEMGDRPNDALIESIFHPVAKHSNTLYEEINKSDVDIDTIKRELIDAFPLPIGEQLRKLLSKSKEDESRDPMETFSQERLEQLVRAFRITVEFVCYIMLSQLWDEKHNHQELSIADDYAVDFNSFLTLNEESYDSFNYVKFLIAIAEVFDDNKIGYFIEELKQVKIDAEKDPSLYKAVVFMNAQHEILTHGAVDPNGLKQACLEAEQCLGILLKSFAFLVKYKLTTIKKIEIIKSKHRRPRFRHNQVRLNRALTIAALGASDQRVDYENYTDSRCVVFIKTEDDKVIDYLNLSPFIIDENALSQQRSTKLFTFSYWKSSSYIYHFIGSAREKPLEINKSDYGIIHEEFTRFKAEVFGIGSEPSGGQGDLLTRLRAGGGE